MSAEYCVPAKVFRFVLPKTRNLEAPYSYCGNYTVNMEHNLSQTYMYTVVSPSKK